MSSTTGSGSMILATSTQCLQTLPTPGERVSTSTPTPVSAATSAPLVLSLSQIQGGGGLLILNSATGNHVGTTPIAPVAVTSFVCNQGQNSSGLTNNIKNIGTEKTVSLKQEAMETSCCHQSTVDNLKMDVTNGNVSFDSSSYSSLPSLSEHISPEPKASSTPKPMDTSTVLEIKSSYSDSGNKHDVGFFNETLDLSQEDIQKTLSANMPSCSADRIRKSDGDLGDTGELNPMDFIGNDVSPPDDDVFVNLEAFDMLGDFPELEVLEPTSSSGTTTTTTVSTSQSGVTATPPEKTGSQSSPRMDYREGTANITDYSPEWAYPEVRAR